MSFADEEKEPDLDTHWKAWKADPTPESGTSLLAAADPLITRAVKTHVGNVNPLVKAKARRMALSAFQNYDPSKGNLQNHLYTHLQGLKRYNAQTSSPLRVPERLMLERSYLERSGVELNDKLGRDPTLDELADHTGMSPHRIARVRMFKSPMNSGYFDSVEEGEGNFSPAVKQDPVKSFVHMVYADLEPTDKKIMEWTLGLGGAPKLSNQQIASKLRLTPGAVSQRKSKLQRVLDQEQELSPFGA
jgi:DNA-directed RNA polymerase specialized sigma subunit